MPITNDQLKARRNWVGCSDVPAIMGVSEYQTAGDVYHSKATELDEQRESTAAWFGNAVEDTVLDWYQRECGYDIERNVHVPYPNEAVRLAANLDAQRTCDGVPVNAKSSGICSPLEWAQWGPFDTDEVPAPVLVQAQAEMLCADAKEHDVVALLGGRGFGVYTIARHDALCEMILERVQAFWRCVENRTPPKEPPRIDTLRRMPRRQGARVRVPEQLVERYETAQRKAKAATEDLQAAKEALLASLGDAEYGDFGDGSTEIRYATQKRKGYTVEPAEMRVLRFGRKPREQT